MFISDKRGDWRCAGRLRVPRPDPATDRGQVARAAGAGGEALQGGHGRARLQQTQVTGDLWINIAPCRY